MMSDNNVSGSESLQLSFGPNPPRPSSLYTDEGDRTPRHGEFYIPSGDVVFKAENTLFRVHRYFLVRESPVFRDMLSMPPPSNGSTEGVSDENPIHLPQVTAIGFAHFLWVFYNPKYSIYDASMDEWTAILRLAHRWEFAEVRELGRMHIPPVTRLVLAEKYDAAPNWHVEALTELGNRAEPLTLAEGEELGLRTALRVAELRESIYRRNDNNRPRRRYNDSRRSRSPSPFRGGLHITPPQPPVMIRAPRTPSPPPVIIQAPYTPLMVPEIISLNSASQIGRVESKKRRFVRFLRSVFGRT